MSNIITLDYNGAQVDFTGEAWFNATAVARRFDKAPNEWLRLPETITYLAGLERRYGKIPYVKTSRARLDRGGGTWLHPRLGVSFARWLDVDFAIWCDEQIDRLLRGEGLEHKRLRHEAASSFKVMNEIRRLALEAEGKEPKRHHFINEARLVNYALTGEFSGQDREAMTIGQLDALAKIEERNAVLIGLGHSYEQRKAALQSFSAAQIRG